MGWCNHYSDVIHFVSAGNSLRDTLRCMDEWMDGWMNEMGQGERKRRRWMSLGEGGRRGKVNSRGERDYVTYSAHFQVHIYILNLYWDMSPGFLAQKALYFSHTACAAAPLFTLCLKPEPSLLWLVSWPALLRLVNRLEMSRPLAYHVQCVGALANRIVQ